MNAQRNGGPADESVQPPRGPIHASAAATFEALGAIPGISNLETNLPTADTAPTASRDTEDWPEHTIVVFDVDGVIAPIGGPTAWGDDITIGLAEGSLLFSPAMCAEIDKLDGHPGTRCYWLTDWTQRTRHDRGVPGGDWPSIAEPLEGSTRAEQWAGDWWTALPWWKWWALDEWLTLHPDVRRVVWIDDQLRRYPAPAQDDSSPARRAWTIETALRDGAGVVPLLLAPDRNIGLRPLDLRIINDWILGVR